MSNISNAKRMFLFSGQGSQYVGMGKELYESYPQVRYIYEVGSRVLGYDLAKLCFEGIEGLELSKTQYSQPAIFATSLVALELAKDKGIGFSGVAGHSLGEYAAMVAASMITLEDGFRLIKARGKAMQRCADANGGAMCAVMAKDVGIVKAICEEIDGFVTPVNFNSPAQTVVAGDVAAIDEVIAVCKERKIKAIKLAVNAAFHSKLMANAAAEMEGVLRSVAFSKPSVDFYSNVYGGIIPADTDMALYLAQHIVSPVRFVEELNTAKANGYDNFIELGPGKVLCGLVKKTLADVEVYNIEDEASLTAVVSAL